MKKKMAEHPNTSPHSENKAVVNLTKLADSVFVNFESANFVSVCLTVQNGKWK